MSLYLALRIGSLFVYAAWFAWRRRTRLAWRTAAEKRVEGLR